VVTDPGDYDRVLAAIAANGGEVGAPMRRELARKAFATTAAYDAAIAEWMAHEDGIAFPETTVVAGRLAQQLRYGENPHQAAAFYRTGDARPGVAAARQLQGRELSYNNYGDADAPSSWCRVRRARSGDRQARQSPARGRSGGACVGWDKGLRDRSAYGGWWRSTALSLYRSDHPALH
jgi:AICAR transformylase/IMP cyclohydrolase PurH